MSLISFFSTTKTLDLKMKDVRSAASDAYLLLSSRNGSDVVVDRLINLSPESVSDFILVELKKWIFQCRNKSVVAGIIQPNANVRRIL